MSLPDRLRGEEELVPRSGLQDAAADAAVIDGGVAATTAVLRVGRHGAGKKGRWLISCNEKVKLFATSKRPLT